MGKAQGSVTSMLEAASATAAAASTPTTTNGATGTATAAPAAHARRDEPMMLVPAGFIADVLSGLSGTIGEYTGGFFGKRELGRQIGEAAGPLVKLLPFQVVPPPLSPQSAGPEGAVDEAGEPLIVVPAGFVGGLLGGLGGQLLGGVVGGWLGNEGTGKSVGSALGGVLGGLLPFQVVPPALSPQSTGPDGGTTQEPMVVVPAGFFGDLLSGVAGTVGGLVGGSTGRQIGEAASPFLRLLPFQAVPEDLTPQSAGPDGAAPQEQLVVLPAGFFGNLLSGLAGTVGGAVGGLFGDAATGKAVGNAASPLLKLLPFQAVPAELAPQSTEPGAEAEPLMVVPAGLFQNLLSCWSGALTNRRPEMRDVGRLAGSIADLLPFQAVPADRVPARA